MSSGAAGLQASKINVTLFRQILLIPFVVEGVPEGRSDGRGRAERENADTLERAIESLCGDPRWQKVGEPILHLPQDRLESDEDSETRIRRLAPAYEEFVYFEPYVRKFLYGGKDAGGRSKPPLRLFSRTDVRGLEFDYPASVRTPDRNSSPASQNGEQNPQMLHHEFQVERCNLYLAETGCAVLAVELLYDAGDGGDVDLAVVLSIMESLRRIFPPYFSPRDNDHSSRDQPLEAYLYARQFRWRFGEKDKADGESPVSVEPRQIIDHVFQDAGGERSVPMFQPWRQLLEPLVVEGYAQPGEHADLSQMGDDRAFLMAQVGVPEASRIGEGDWMRLCFADSPGDGLPYGKGFIRDFAKRHAYDRFWHDEATTPWGTRYLICPYAFCVVGEYGGPKTRDGAPVTFNFFRDVLSKHFRRHYFQLVMISILQRSTLLSLSDQLAEASDKNRQAVDTVREVRDVRQRIIRFTHRYWFETVSQQQQADELFSMLRRHLRTRELYAQLSQEVRESSDDIDIQEQNKLARSAEQLNKIAGPALAVGVVAGLFGANVLFDWTLVDRYPLSALAVTLVLVGWGLMWAASSDVSFADLLKKANLLVRERRPLIWIAIVMTLFLLILLDIQIDWEDRLGELF